MPGTSDVFFVLAFTRNEHGEAVPVSKPTRGRSAAEAIAVAQNLSDEFDGVVAWKQHIDPAVGEIRAPEVLVSRGHIGDFA